MNLQEIRDTTNFRLNKDQAGDNMNPSEFNSMLALVNIEYFKSQLGLDSINPIRDRVKGLQATQLLTESTRHLLVNKGVVSTPIAVSASGIMELPDNYFTYTEANHAWMEEIDTIQTPFSAELEVLDDNKWPSRASSTLKKPTLEDPIMRFLSENRCEVRPRGFFGVKRVNLSYVRYPVKPVYQYTLDDDDNEVYDAANSVELDWPEICHPDIINMIVSYRADNNRDMFIKQSAEARKQKGE